MLDVRRNLHNIADRKAPRRLAFLLIPSLARDADEDLPAALLCMMDVPVVAAARLEGHVVNRHDRPLLRQDIQIRLSAEILRIGIIRHAKTESAATLFFVHHIFRFHDIIPF